MAKGGNPQVGNIPVPWILWDGTSHWYFTKISVMFYSFQLPDVEYQHDHMCQGLNCHIIGDKLINPIFVGVKIGAPWNSRIPSFFSVGRVSHSPKKIAAFQPNDHGTSGKSPDWELLSWIATSNDLTSNGGLVREIPYKSGKSRLVKYYFIWPVKC